jgi:hypothetical protein
MSISLLSKIKSRVVPRGTKPRRIAFGLYSGLRMELDLMSRTQLYLGLWERETYPYFRKAASRCSWAVDIGAGQGELSMFLLRHSPCRKIYAFEPQQSETKVLARNLQMNGLSAGDRLLVSNQFVGSSNNSGCVSLDSLQLTRNQRGLIKIDVDGAEMEVLKGGEELLQTAPIDLVLETHSPELEADCADFLKKRGFKSELINNAWWRAIVPETRPIPHNRWLWATRD